MPARLGVSIFSVAALLGLALLGLVSQGQPTARPSAPGKAPTIVRCHDWKKVGAHRWMVIKEVMLGTARRTGTILEKTPETDALDTNCPG